MRRLVLLRHAKTEPAGFGERDRERKLTKRGRADAALIGGYMASHGLVPDLALVSPATRTQETWALASAALAKPPRMRTADRIYNADAEALIGVIGEVGKQAHTLLVVGHNPGLQDLALRLIGFGEVGTRDRLKQKLPTSGLAVIDLPLDDWSLLSAQTGRLERFVSPGLLAKGTD